MQKASLREVFAASAKKLEAELSQLRSGFSHAGTKGQGAEQSLRSLLHSHLPDSIGVTSGQIMDASGALSTQVDIILYDVTKTPQIFVSSHDDRTLPAEGVIACVEVKSRLTKDLLRESSRKAAEIKRMPRRAYLQQSITVSQNRYGLEWVDLPIFCSVFAYETENFYADELRQQASSVPLHEQLDMVCYLDRGISMHASVAKDVNSVGSPIHLHPTATPQSAYVDIPSDDALLLWFVSLFQIVMSAQVRPVNLMEYLEESVTRQPVPLGQEHPLTPEAQAMALAQLDNEHGLPPGTMEILIRGTLSNGGPKIEEPSEIAFYFDALVALLAGGNQFMPSSEMARWFVAEGVLGPHDAEAQQPPPVASDFDLGRLHAIANEFREGRRDRPPLP